MEKCVLSGAYFEIFDFEREYCESNGIPIPEISPRERLRNLLIFRNRPYLYHGTCDLSGDKFLTCIPPEGGLKVYDADVWESDQWDPLSYGRDYDFNRPFFEQFYELYLTVPQPNLAVVRSSVENSDYTNGITGAKNCYLLFSSSENEDCLFSFGLWRSKNIVDGSFLRDSELCYECSDLLNCYNLKFARHCVNCNDSTFLCNCQSCSNCFGCVNLNHKEYYFYNEALSKDEYQQKLCDIDLGSRISLEQHLKRFEEFSGKFPIKEYFGKQNESSSGNFLFNNRNCKDCSFVSGSEDLYHSVYIEGGKSSVLHANWGGNSELIYNSIGVGDRVYNLRFCSNCWQGAHDLEYCMYCCFGTGNCFGSIGLRRAEYCILNKRYKKDPYHEALSRIKAKMRSDGEYGLFFPIHFSPHYYNESSAHNAMPLDKKTAISWGFRWNEDQSAGTVKYAEAPDHIRDVKRSILTENLKCPLSGKVYKIIASELEFYKKENLPIPAISPLERIRSRLKIFRLKELEESTCSNCGKEMQTVYADSLQPVYCEECFQSEVFR